MSDGSTSGFGGLMLKTIMAALAAAFCVMGAAYAADAPQLTPEQKAALQKMFALNKSLHPVHGEVALPDAKARLALGSGYYFLGAEDAKKVLVEGWGNPPGSADGVLGIIFPEGKSFIDSSWGAVVTYVQTDFVPDTDAKTAAYDKLLKEMQSGEDEENEARKKEGFRAVHLVGWAQPPSYDAARHNLIWAREIAFAGEDEHTLNYDVRHLGRRGVLSLNMVSTLPDLAGVRTAAQELAKTAEFDAGSRYADFQQGDKTAGYGLAGLVAAGAGLAVAKKAGFLAVVLVFAKKGIALIVAAGAGVAAWFRKRLGKKPPATPAAAPPEQDTDEAP
jgi:uncharacterized membrane-anchored protein